MSTELKYKVMDDEVRMEIARLYKDGWKVGDIADAVGLHETSVYRELNRGMTDKLDANGRFEYDIDKARLDAARARANKGKFKGVGVDGRCKCHPYSSYERGSNENQNRMFRRLFPKGTNFDEVPDEEIIAAADWMNNYPREILGRTTAARVFNEQLAQITA